MNTTITSISPQELHQLRHQGQAPLLIDVRSVMEYNGGHAEGAVNLPLPQVTPQAVQALRQGKDSEPVYVICHSGGRSKTACERLAAANLPNIVNVTGGTAAWKQAGLPVVRQPGSLQPYIRPVGIAVILTAIILGFTVSAYFFILAVVAWVGIVLTAGCPLLAMLRPSKGCSSGGCCLTR